MATGCVERRIPTRKKSVGRGTIACGHVDMPHEALGLCRSCYRKRRRVEEPELHAAADKRRYKKRKEKIRNYQVEYFYGISWNDYQRILGAQSGVCAICGNTNQNGRRLSVDHDHSTNKVRGLLCSSCNIGIGNFRESPLFLAKGIEYLTGGKQ